MAFFISRFGGPTCGHAVKLPKLLLKRPQWHPVAIVERAGLISTASKENFSRHQSNVSCRSHSSSTRVPLP
jgi:hypothetical protein